MFEGTLEFMTGKQIRLRQFDAAGCLPDDITAVEAAEVFQYLSIPVNKDVNSMTVLIKEQVRALLERLQKWGEKHRSSISRADVRGMDSDGILFVVMQKGVPYDFDLSEKLTDLDIEIANSPDFDLITLNVLAIPRCSHDAAQAFIDWERNICIVDFTNDANP